MYRAVDPRRRTGAGAPSMIDGVPASENGSGRALVVDADPQAHRRLAELLRAQGFDCAVAETAGDARRRVQEEDPCVVLLEVSLPDESALRLARELSSHDAGPAVIMMGGHEDPAVAAIALDAGAVGFLAKPFKRHEVQIAVHNALRHRRIELEHRARRALLEDRVVERSTVARDALAQLRTANEETVRRLSKAIEFRDPETGSHIERMSHYCALLASQLGLDPDEIRVASRLHDIGKIAVPDAILLKPGPLSAAEREEMERHAEIGYRLLRGSRIDVLEQAATIAWTHHERFDGTGYPRGLAGEEIPLSGRIACVADVFDALTSDRIYRPARPLEEGVAALAAERGRQFDPLVADAFLADMDAVTAIMARFDDGPRESPLPREAAPDPGPAPITLQEAAATLGVSASRLRRWADEGRIPAVRTAGGHRRFPIDAVRRLAAERGTGPAVRPIEPPAMSIPTLAERLRQQGVELASAAAGSLYRGGPTGWFGRDDARTEVREWLSALERACESGRHAGALQASEVLMRGAARHAATLLERHSFLERFAAAALRALSQAGAPASEMAAARRLFAALQQAMLDGRP
jgi:putative two-component system response regulator